MKEVKVKVGEWWRGQSHEEREVIFLPQGGYNAAYWNHTRGTAGDAPRSDERFWHRRIKDEHGNPVEPEQEGERRCLIKWDMKSRYACYEDDGATFAVPNASGRTDFIAFEAEDGSQCSASPYWWIYHEVIQRHKDTVITQAAVKTALSKKESESDDLESIRARWVILAKEEK